MERIPEGSLWEVEYAVAQLLRSLSSGLDVSFKLAGLDENGHLSIDVEGEDLEVFASLLNRNFILAPMYTVPPTVNLILKAVVKGVDDNGAWILLDLGSSTYEGFLTKEYLTAILVDGKDLPMPSLGGLFCLMEGVPLEVRITAVDEHGRRIYCELTSLQLSLFNGWISDFLDRIIVVGVTRRQVKNALAETGNLRRVIEIERLGFLSHVIPCKLGYNVNSIKDSLERLLPQASMCLFSSQRIAKRIGAPVSIKT